MENLYEVLQVSEKASKEVIEKSYKTLVKKYHPDVAKNKSKAEEIMKKLNNAYEILGDANKRKEYDEKLENERFTKRKNDININMNNEIKTTTNPNTTRTYNNYRNIYNNNMYENQYNSYYDYINNPNIFKRFLTLSSDSIKLVIFFVIVFFVLLINVIFDIYGMTNKTFDKKNIQNNNENKVVMSAKAKNNEEVFKDDNELNIVFVDFMNELQDFSIDNLNNYLSESTELTSNQISNIKSDRKLITRIVNNMKIDINNSQSSDLGNGKINIKIERVNMDQILLEASRYIFTNYSINYTDEILNDLILEFFDKNIDIKITQVEEVKFIKENGKWKIVLSNDNIYVIFGYNIKNGI